jgi:hypothetical protein
MTPGARLDSTVKNYRRNLFFYRSLTSHQICSEDCLSFNERGSAINVSEGLHVPDRAGLFYAEALGCFPTAFHRFAEVRLDNALKQVKRLEVSLVLRVDGVLNPLLLVDRLVSKPVPLVLQQLWHPQ